MTDTAHLAPDEKRCPYCAETIKAAAVRCRYCHSDLLDGAGTQPAPGPAAEPAPRPSGGAARSWPLWLLTAALAVAVVIGAVVLVRLLTADDATTVPDGNSPLVAGARIEGPEVKRAAMMAATDATQKVLSYSAATLDDDIATAENQLAGEMLAQYRETMDAIREQTSKNEAAVEATVVAASIISATEHDAKVLLFVNQSTTGKHLDQPRVDLNRVVVTMHRDAGDWSITRLDAL